MKIKSSRYIELIILKFKFIQLELEAVLRAQQEKCDEIDSAVGNLRNLKNTQNKIEDLNEEKADEVTSLKKSMRNDNAKIKEMQVDIDDTKSIVRKMELTVIQAKTDLDESLEKERALKVTLLFLTLSNQIKRNKLNQ